MASSSSHKPLPDTAIYDHDQDSAVDLQDVSESSQAPRSRTRSPQPHHVLPTPDVNTAEENDDGVLEFDSDSAFDSGSLLGDETDTLASSILNHRIENGRQYHAYRDGAYWGPNDELAKEILDFAHHMYLLTLDQKLYLAPITCPETILDIGTGTGIWAIVRHLGCSVGIVILTLSGHGRSISLRDRNRHRSFPHTA
jgi:hypothetical protein